MGTLSESISRIGNLIYVLKEQDQTDEYVKNKIRMIDLQDKKLNDNAKFGTLKVSSSSRERLCYGCGRPRHFNKDCCQTGTNRGTWQHCGQFRNSSNGIFQQCGGYGNW